MDIRKKSKNERADSPWNQLLSPEERLKNFREQFGHLQLSHYLRQFSDKSKDCILRIPSEGEADVIFNEMHKTTPESREINCSACGYNNCYDMMVAIYNGFNTKHSCIHFEMDEAIRLERLSMNDHLTGVMNRSGLQNMLANQYLEKPLAVIAVDVNGLKETNDTLGHEAGDRLIVDVATCLAMTFGAKKVFRVGGDEFIALQQDYTEEECVEKIQKFRNRMAACKVSAAVGYAYNPCYDSDFIRMQAIADKWMYKDKERYYRETGKKRR